MHERPDHTHLLHGLVHMQRHALLHAVKCCIASTTLSIFNHECQPNQYASSSAPQTPHDNLLTRQACNNGACEVSCCPLPVYASYAKIDS